MTAQLPKLWTCMDEVLREDERGKGLGPSAVGLQCNDRSFAEFRTDMEAGIRDAVAFHSEHVLIVQTPRQAGLGLALKAMFRGAPSVVPYMRVPRARIVAVEVTETPPDGWRLLGSEFLRITTRSGVNWHWLDETSMEGKRERFNEGLVQFVAGLTEQNRSLQP